MTNANKRKLRWSIILFGLCLLTIIVVYYIAKEKSVYDILALVFTAVGTMATLVTSYIAILLFDRFGLEQKRIENNNSKVQELISFLENFSFLAEVKGYKYIARLSSQKLSSIVSHSTYQEDKNKKILISQNDYNKSLGKMIELFNDKLLPAEIREKAKFLQPNLLIQVDNPDDNVYMKIDFYAVEEKKWMLFFPEMTFEELITNSQSLLKEINNWENKYSDNPILL